MTIVLRPMTGAVLRRRLTEIVVRVLNTSNREGTPAVTPAMVATQSFAALGMDSLAGAELTAEIEDGVGFELSPSDVFVYPDIESLARFIERDAAGVGPAIASYVRPEGDAAHARRMRRMLDDAVLPPEIVPSPGVSRRGAVLVTGATGFVGAHLVRAILRRTPGSVRCLVRPRGRDYLAGAQRVRNALERYGVWDDSFAPRIDVVDGDISRPSLDLSAGDFAALSDSVDEIFHAAADVDWIQPYEGLRETNVIGTRELLRLACTGTAKPFHFVSSLGVCYSTGWRDPGLESDNPIDGLAGLHLGYAQSKCVAEALVREAGQRGLRVTIVRPALVSGDSESGVSNQDDLLSLFIRGCIRMGAAPDLDWVMDSVPADHAADVLVRLAGEVHLGSRVFHLSNARSRHWRECVLWMRLRGYPLELLPYNEWACRLRSVAPDHPLHALRSFFLGAVAGQDGLSLPELYEESRRRPIRTDESRAALQAIGARCPPLDARLLDRYFASYVERGVIEEAAGFAEFRGRANGGGASGIDRLREQIPGLESDMRARGDDPELRIVSADLTPMGGDDSIVAELTSWRRSTGAGLYRARLGIVADQDVAPTQTDAVIKAKPSDGDVIEIGGHVAHLCSALLGAQYDAWREHVGFTRGHVRELAVYESAPVRARPYMPRILASVSDPEREEWILAIEHVSDAAVINAWNRPWAMSEIDAALRGLAQLHAAWIDKRAQLTGAAWLPPIRTPELMVAMRPLWSELATNARPMFDRWAGSGLTTAHRALVETIDQWWHPLMDQPRTLIHNDFNPRNILLRRIGGDLRLCAFDWELATIGAPQRDLAELLCFVLDPDVAGEQVEAWITRGRQLLEMAVYCPIDADEWAAGFRAALGDLLVDRLAMYAMLHRIRPQAFLPRVVRTWLAIHSRVGSAAK
jgi:thioester reductase-like protein